MTTSTRQRRHERTRQDILTAALQIINEEGRDKLSLREIARRIDYSPAGIYEYFGSKEEIIDAVCAEGSRAMVAALSVVPETLPPDEYLIELGLAYIDYALKNTEHFIMFNRMGPDVPVDYADISIGEPYLLVIRAVQRALDAGIITGCEGFGQHEIAYSLWTLAHGMATLQATQMRNVRMNYSAINRHAFETFLCGLR